MRDPEKYTWLPPDQSDWRERFWAWVRRAFAF